MTKANPNAMEDALYTLRPNDYHSSTTGKTYPSLYRAYLEMEDVTEFEFAEKYFESYEHFERLLDSKFFKEFIEKCRRHLELKLKARALRNIQILAEDDQCKDHMQANKYLIDKGYDSTKEDKGTKKTKLTQKQIKEAQKIELENMDDQSRIEQDYERILN